MIETHQSIGKLEVDLKPRRHISGEEGKRQRRTKSQTRESLTYGVTDSEKLAILLGANIFSIVSF